MNMLKPNNFLNQAEIYNRKQQQNNNKQTNKKIFANIKI